VYEEEEEQADSTLPYGPLQAESAEVTSSGLAPLALFSVSSTVSYFIRNSIDFNPLMKELTTSNPARQWGEVITQVENPVPYSVADEAIVSFADAANLRRIRKNGNF